MRAQFKRFGWERWIWWRGGTAQPLTPRHRHGSYGGCHFGSAYGRASPELGHSAAHPSGRWCHTPSTIQFATLVPGSASATNPSTEAQRLPPFRLDPVAFEFPCPLPRPPGAPRPSSSLCCPTVDLSAVIMAATPDEPRVLTVRVESAAPRRPALRALAVAAPHPGDGPAELGGRADPADLGYVEQLYTFGDRDRAEAQTRGPGMPCRLPIWRWCARPALPDWRMPTGGTGIAIFRGRTGARAAPRRSGSDRAALEGLGARAGGKTLEAVPRGADRAHIRVRGPGRWTDERVLERYELLFEAGLVPEALRDAQPPGSPKARLAPGQPMALDHRRILATAIGRLRGKIKYRPVIFELMPASFTLLRAAEDGRGSVRGAPAQAELPPPGRDAGAGRGNRRGHNRDGRPPGPARALPARGAGRAPGPRRAPARA